MNESDEYFMNIAMKEAKKASWPFGAVIVRDGEIIAQAGSGDGKDIEIDPTAHAEVNAIRRACVKLNTGNLAGAILYASCEPCALCFGAAWYANIKEINKAWGGDLAFPHNHIFETGIHMRGGILKDAIMKMYVIHSYVINRSKFGLTNG
jgi:deoxycytidylate deaminase